MGFTARDDATRFILGGAAAEFGLFTMVGVCLAFWRRNMQPIQFRGVWLLSTVMILLVIRQITVMVFALYPSETPCGVRSIFTFTFFAAYGFTLLRLVKLLFAYGLQDERMRVHERLISDANRKSKVTRVRGWVNQRRKSGISTGTKRSSQPSLGGLSRIADGERSRKSSNGSERSAKTNLTANHENITVTGAEWYMNHAYWMHPAFTNLMLIIMVATPTVIEMYGTYEVEEEDLLLLAATLGNSSAPSFEDRCISNVIFAESYLVSMIFYTILVAFVAYKLSLFPRDGFFLKSEMKLTAIIGFLLVVTDVVIQNTIDASVLKEYGIPAFSELFYVHLLSIVILYLPVLRTFTVNRRRGSSLSQIDENNMGSSIVMEEGGSHSFHFKHHLPEGSNVPKLLSIMSNDNDKAVLHEFMKREFSVENFLFIEDCRKLIDMIMSRNVVGNSNSKAATADSIISSSVQVIEIELLDQVHNSMSLYVSEGGALQVNLSSKSREALEKKADILFDLFDDYVEFREDGVAVEPAKVAAADALLLDFARLLEKARVEIILLVSRDALMRFLNSDEYAEISNRKRGKKSFAFRNIGASQRDLDAE